MNIRLWNSALRLAGLGTLLMLPLNVLAQSNTGKYGVGMVPFLNGGDETEQGLHSVVGNLPEIDHVYDIDDSLHMLRTIVKLGRSGRKIDYLVIAGHGSRDTPGIKFAKDDMVPQEVDLAWNENDLKTAKWLLQNPKQTKMTPDQLRARINDLQTRIDLLHAVSDCMAKNAVVLLVNCSAAATPQGQKFVQDFGQVLLGKKGGQIIASKIDIVLSQRDSVLQRLWTRVRTGEWAEAGEYRVGGDWVSFPIKGAPKNDIWGVVKPKGDIKPFVGTWEQPYHGGKSTLTINASGSGTSGALGTELTNGKPSKEVGTLSQGVVDGQTLTCHWESTYSDGDKTITRGGTLTLTVNGDTLTANGTVDPESIKEQWNVGKYPSRAKSGGTSTYKRAK